jgi:hypothetical protein
MDILTCTNDSLVGLSVNSTSFSQTPAFVLGGRLNLTRLIPFGPSLTQLRVRRFFLASSTPDSNALSQLTNLRSLELVDLELVGKYPDGIVQLRRLQHLDLSLNKFNGSLFLLDKLPTSLLTLRLNGNQFVSPIASIDHLSLFVFNISYNRLTGAAPVFDGRVPNVCSIMDDNDTNCLNNCMNLFCCRSNCTTAVLVTPPPTPFPIGIAPTVLIPGGSTPPRTLPPAVTASTTTTTTFSFSAPTFGPNITKPFGPTKPTSTSSTSPSATASTEVATVTAVTPSVDTSNSEAIDVSSEDMTSTNTAIAIGVGVGGGLICLLGLVAAVWLWRRSNKFEQESTERAVPADAAASHVPSHPPPPVPTTIRPQYMNVPDASNIASAPVRRSSSRRSAPDGFVPPIKMTRRVSSRRRSKKPSSRNVYSAIDTTGRGGHVNSNQYVDVGAADAFATANVGKAETVNLADMQTARRRVQTVRDIYQIPVSDLKLGETLGQGAFGVVVRADWKGAIVAVKQIRRDVVGNSSKAMHEFKNEVKQMAAIPPHKNVVRLFGVSKMGDDMAAVVEYCGGGALSTALFGDAPVAFTSRELHRIAVDSASGIVHLHNHGTVHRDIAARNVLLTTDRQAKVADFGMSRDSGVASSLDENVTVQDLGPIKYMAPEQLERRAYSRATDTWAFGVLLFEIFERELPWRGVPNLRVATTVLDGGHLKPTAKTPVKVQALMEQCFAADPRLRIALSDVEKQLRDLEKSA